MERINLVLTAGLNSLNILKMPEVSTPHIRIIIMCNTTTGNRDIRTLPVKCSYVDRECKWVGTVGTLETHVATCEFTLVPCPNECKDDKNEIAHFMKKDLDKHLENDCPNRDHKCKYCGVKGTYAHITQVHDNTCEKKIIPCPNAGCTEEIQRQNSTIHLDECGYTEIPCKYKKLGCDVKMVRKMIPAHEENEDKLHLHMALEVGQSGGTMTFQLTNFHEKKKNNAVFKSPAFYTSPNAYRLQVTVYANGYNDGKGAHVSVYTNILAGKNDAKLKWPLVGNIGIQILNQLEDKNHYEMIMRMDEAKVSVGHDWGYHKCISHSKLAYDQVKHTEYLKDDTLYFRVSLDVPDHKSWLECTAN